MRKSAHKIAASVKGLFHEDRFVFQSLAVAPGMSSSADRQSFFSSRRARVRAGSFWIRFQVFVHSGLEFSARFEDVDIEGADCHLGKLLGSCRRKDVKLQKSFWIVLVAYKHRSRKDRIGSSNFYHGDGQPVEAF